MDLTKYIKEFNDFGVVLIKDFFSNEEANDIVSYADNLEKLKESPGKYMIYFEKTNSEKFKSRIENFLKYDNNIKEFFDSKIQQFANKMNNTSMNLLKEKMNWKRSGGKGFKAHQDQPAWNDFSPKKYVTVAVFANKCTKENGCLQFGYDKNGKKFDDYVEYNKEGLGEINEKLESELNWKYFESNINDILLFDSYVPHRSFENTTNSSRRIFYFTFHDSKYGNFYDSYINNKRKYFPPDIERNKDVNILNNKYNLANPIV